MPMSCHGSSRRLHGSSQKSGIPDPFSYAVALAFALAPKLGWVFHQFDIWITTSTYIYIYDIYTYLIQIYGYQYIKLKQDEMLSICDGDVESVPQIGLDKPLMRSNVFPRTLVVYFCLVLLRLQRCSGYVFWLEVISGKMRPQHTGRSILFFWSLHQFPLLVVPFQFELSVLGHMHLQLTNPGPELRPQGVTVCFTSGLI